MSEIEFLEGIDLLWNIFGHAKSEAEYGEWKDRLAWLVSEYKQPNEETAHWWKDGLPIEEV